MCVYSDQEYTETFFETAEGYICSEWPEKRLICDSPVCFAAVAAVALADVSLKGKERRSNQPRNSIRPGIKKLCRAAAPSSGVPLL